MLKLIANITMVIDHIGLAFFPAQMWLRAIGRISMPLFALGIATGYEHTKKKGTTPRYLCRLLLFSIISQLPYSMMNQGWCNLNIGWTYVGAILIFVAVDRFPNVGMLSAIPILVGAELLHFDGGMFGILVTLQSYYFIVKPGHKWWGYFACVPLHVIRGILCSAPIYVLAAAAYPIAYLLRAADHKIQMPRWLAYSIYPAHMTLFGFLRMVFQYATP